MRRLLWLFLLATATSTIAQTKPVTVFTIRSPDMGSTDFVNDFKKRCPAQVRPVTDPASADYVFHAATQASWLADHSGHVVFVTEAILGGSAVKDICHFLGAK